MGENCDQCKLEWEDDGEDYSMDETFCKEKSFQRDEVQDMTKPAGTKDFSFAMRLKKEVRLLCELFVELFKYGVRETLLPNGTDLTLK